MNVLDEAGQLESPAQSESVVRTRVIPLVAVVLVVGLLGLLAYALFAPESGRVDPGWSLTDDGARVYTVPKPAPDFELMTFDGEPFRLSDHRGQVVVLNFWASWCEPCIAEMPLLNRIADEFEGDEVVMVGVNIWDLREQADRFVEQLNVTYTVVEDEPTVAVGVEFGVTGVPETFVVNPDGEIVVYFVGEFTNAQQIRNMIALAR